MASQITDFANLGLEPALLRAVREAGYDTPTPIQVQAIPLVLDGHDLLAAAQTGTGKTAGFTVPILQRLGARTGSRPAGTPRCLVLTPTRELAAQISESVKTYGKYSTLRAELVFGGVNVKRHIEAMGRPVDILVATPGRLLDLVGQGVVDLASVEILVLDEADRMLDMGFIHDIRRVLRLLPDARQNLLFSATFSDEIRALARTFMNRPQEVSVAKRNAPADAVDQRVYEVDRAGKRALLAHLIAENGWSQVLVFTRTKHGANRLAEQLGKDGIDALAIHGNKSQGARTRALSRFKAGELTALVATDIAARGLDIERLPHVVNYELPNVPEDYVHRIGRTGRAGSVGEAVSLVDADEVRLLAGIERLIGRRIPVGEVIGHTGRRVPTSESDEARPAAAHRSRGGSGHGRDARAGSGVGRGRAQERGASTRDTERRTRRRRRPRQA